MLAIFPAVRLSLWLLLLVVLRIGCARFWSSLAFYDPCGLFLISSVRVRVIQSITLLFFPDCLFIFSGLEIIKVVSVFHQGQLLYVLHGIDFSLPGLGKHHVLHDLIWFLGGCLASNCLLCGFRLSSCPTFFLLTPNFWRSSVSGLDWGWLFLGGSRRCLEAWWALGSL